MQNVRLFFSKTFDARYISHLDLMRCFERAIKKSGIGAWYTEGFNSHIYLVFSLPMSLGAESICESVDVRLVNDDFDAGIPERINPHLPFGVEIYNAAIAKMKISDIAYARYLIELADESVDAEAIKNAVEAALEPDVLEVEKISKKTGRKLVDIKPMIKESSAYVQNGVCYIDAVLAAGQPSLNPSELLKLTFLKLGRETDHQLIKRTQILTADLKNFE